MTCGNNNNGKRNGVRMMRKKKARCQAAVGVMRLLSSESDRVLTTPTPNARPSIYIIAEFDGRAKHDAHEWAQAHVTIAGAVSPVFPLCLPAHFHTPHYYN